MTSADIQEIIDKIVATLKAREPGVTQVSFDGRVISYRDLTNELDYWQSKYREALAVEAGQPSTGGIHFLRMS
jgi:hypothetical protein